MFRYTNSISTPTRHKRPKRSKTPAVAALAVIGVFCCSSLAFGHHSKVLGGDYERKKSEVFDKLDRLIADELVLSFNEPHFFVMEQTLDSIEAWEGYCRDREFDD